MSEQNLHNKNMKQEVDIYKIKNIDIDNVRFQRGEIGSAEFKTQSIIKTRIEQASNALEE